MSEAEVNNQAPPHPDWPAWSCELRAAPDNLSPQRWTVGDRYVLKCEGSSIEPLKDSIKLTFPSEAFAYTLHPLKTIGSTQNFLELEVTGYKPGQFESPWLEISDEAGESGFRAENLSWTVESIIQPGGTPPQPIMHVNALGLSYPIWLWVALALGVLVPAFLMFRKLRRRAEVKRLVEQLTQSSSALRPYDLFSKEVRGLVRKYNYHAQDQHPQALEFLKELNVSFKAYLTRSLKIPAQAWSPSEVSKEMKKQDRGIYKEITKEVKNALLEMNKAEAASKVQPEDADQFKKMSMQLAEKIFKAQEAKAKR